MNVIWTNNKTYNRIEYVNENDLENAILEIHNELFGANRIYIDIKKKIGAKGNIRNIPDGYLLDLSGGKPKLYVVENELSSHDPLRHIAVQILQFSLSFETDQRSVKSIIFDALQKMPEAKNKSIDYAQKHNYRNLDHMLEWIVFEGPFAALVIIDEIPENLESILVRKFQFGVEVLELSKYRSEEGNIMYCFSPFLADVTEDVESSGANLIPDRGKISVDEIDTIVVPSHEEGFQETFIGENRWHHIRIHGSMKPQIKYIAVYRVAPVSAITHIAQVKSIEPWKDTDKYLINFAEPAKEIDPIPLVAKERNGRVKALQNTRYTSKERLEAAKTLDDIW